MKTLIPLSFLLLSAAISSCQTTEKSVVGKWNVDAVKAPETGKMDENGLEALKRLNEMSKGETIDFEANGTYAIRKETVMDSGTYTVEGNNITLTNSEGVVDKGTLEFKAGELDLKSEKMILVLKR